VEELLDSCHALMNYGVDRYKRPQRCRWRRKSAPARAQAYMQSQVNELWRTLPAKRKRPPQPWKAASPRAAGEPAVLHREERAAAGAWEREVMRIVRKIGQYFYPQRQTQVMNEGWATFWHYTLLNTLYDEGRLTDGFMMEFLQSHTNVVYQPPITSPITTASTRMRWASR
jgi:spore cortex formation protein SpoVR/YcgB (stage V sporulation)